MSSLFLSFLREILLFFLLRTTQIFISILVILGTTRGSLLRPASIAIQILVAVAAFRGVCSDGIRGFVHPNYRAILGGMVVLQTIWTIDASVLLKWDAESVERDVLASKRPHKSSDDASGKKTEHQIDGNGKEAKPSVTTGEKVKWLFDLSGNARCIDTPYRVKGISPWDPSRPDWVPSRAEAIRSYVIELVVCYVARDLLLTFGWDRIPIGCFWLLYYRFHLDYPRLIFGIIALSSGDDVESWPPMFGSFWESSTIRGFWGKFWHQNLRFTFQTFSDHLCKQTLGLTGLVQRYANIFTVFALSGMMHMFSDMASSIPPTQSGALKTFCMQAVGIMIEDGVQALWRRYSKRGAGNKDAPTPLWAKILGWIWTWTFLTYSCIPFMAPYKQGFRDNHIMPVMASEALLSLLGYSQSSGHHKEL